MKNITVVMDVYIRQGREYTIEIPDDGTPVAAVSIVWVPMGQTIEGCEIVNSFEQ